MAKGNRDKPLSVSVAAWLWIILGFILVIGLLRALAEIGAPNTRLREGAGSTLLVMLALTAAFLFLGFALKMGKRWALPIAIAVAGLWAALVIVFGIVAVVVEGEFGAMGIVLGVGVVYYGPLILLLLPSSRRWFRSEPPSRDEAAPPSPSPPPSPPD